ncbi:MAG: hypothetical protein RMK29_19640 [Myxococcales bacterium]|nr:hypothetical protein [Myxococcota bacterium]MDW8283921.1 hypothetical protein [Myxococcales bacterium]
MIQQPLRTILRLAAVATLLGACGAPPPEAVEPDPLADLERRLDLPNGGFTFEDEPPGFGDDSLALWDETLREMPDLLGDLSEGADLYEGEEDPSILPGELEEKRPGDPNRDDPRWGGPPRDGRCPPPCPRGLLLGRSKELRRGMGVFGGVRLNMDLRVIGFVKGVYGRDRFFGKMTDPRGRTQALMSGRLRGAFFLGRYMDRRGPQGVVMGHIGRGHLLGKWMAFCRPPRGGDPFAPGDAGPGPGKDGPIVGGGGGPVEPGRP